MKSRYLINIVLIVLVLILYWFLNQPSPRPQQVTVSNITQNEITEITITRLELDTIKLQKKAVGWQLISPLQAPANNTRIKLLLSILNTPSYAQLQQTDTATLTQLGFNDASTTLQLNNDSFQFGTIEPISQRRYVLYNNRVHLIDDNVAPLLKANATSFIDNKLLPLEQQVSKISLPTLNQQQMVSTDTILIEQQDGHWQAVAITLSTDQLITLIDSWQHAYALQVLPLRKTTLPNSEIHLVKIWYRDQKEPTEFELQRDDRTLYLNNPSLKLSYQFPISLIQQLLPNP
jgi:hypothetical protein